MRNIKFSANWNHKLNNSVFSTIRAVKDNPDYYQSKEGSIFNVYLKDTLLYAARLLKVEVLKFKDIPHYVLMMDTGYNNYEDAVKLFHRFYGKETADISEKPFYLLLFNRVSEIRQGDFKNAIPNNNIPVS